MDPVPVAASDIAQVTLLTAARLRLAEELRTVELRADRVVVKYQPGRRYLVCTQPQWQLLEGFVRKRTVPDLLLEIIPEGRCPPLREFYELIVKAVHHGILQADGQRRPPPEPPAAWPFSLHGVGPRWSAVMSIGFGLLMIFLRGVQLPEDLWPLALGWLLAAGAMSAGFALAACAVRGAGSDVYHPHLRWKTPLPHFHVDLGDAVMGGRDTAIDAALLRLAPLFAVTGLAAFRLPELLFPLLCAIFFDLSPLWPSPVSDLLRTLYRDPQLSTAHDFMFVRNRLLTLLLKSRLKLPDRRFLLASVGGTLAWLLIVFLTSCLLLQANALDLFSRFYIAGGIHTTAIVLLAAFAGLVLGTAAVFSWIALRNVRNWLRDRASRLVRPRATPVDAGTITESLRRTLLFREFSLEDLMAVAAAVQPEEYDAGTYVTLEGEQGDRLYIVHSGHLAVTQRLREIKRTDPFGELRAGDLFGDRAVLEDGRHTATVRCVSRCVLLTLTKTDFERLILPRVSRQVVEDKVQKIGFLQQIELSRDWSQTAMAIFARHAVFRDFAPGEALVRPGEAFRFFCLVQEGEFAVMKKHQQVARLRRGDFYGELSLLQDTVATVTIVANTPSRCLLVPLQDFLQFITHDFAVGLQFEEIGSDRLGRPVFVSGG
ncbi:MAG TPA: cyclic nucleotide-binding domain-containing protein [Opitutaceae bacterium]|nr:cyclic nucleotide-binding domain-containing protein [Opitutaceae bacterium]